MPATAALALPYFGAQPRVKPGWPARPLLVKLAQLGGKPRPLLFAGAALSLIPDVLRCTSGLLRSRAPCWTPVPCSPAARGPAGARSRRFCVWRGELPGRPWHALMELMDVQIPRHIATTLNSKLLGPRCVSLRHGSDNIRRGSARSASTDGGCLNYRLEVHG